MPCTTIQLVPFKRFKHDRTGDTYRLICTAGAIRISDEPPTWRYGSFVVYTADPVKDHGQNFVRDAEGFCKRFSEVRE